MLTQVSSLLLLKRQDLLLPFPTHLAPSYETLFAPPTPNTPAVDWCSSANKKVQFNLQRSPKECNLLFLARLVFFHFSELNLCTQVNVRAVSGQVSGAWLGACVCVWNQMEGTAGASPAFMSVYWQCYETAWILLHSSVHSPSIVRVFLMMLYLLVSDIHRLGQLPWRTNVKTPARPPRG